MLSDDQQVAAALRRNTASVGSLIATAAPSQARTARRAAGTAAAL